MQYTSNNYIMSDKCQSCFNSFNKKQNKLIRCSKCEFNACKECYETWIINEENDAKCMNCKTLFSNRHIISNLGQIFLKKYNKIQKEKISQAELLKLQSTQEYIENIEKIKYNNELLKDQIYECELKKQKLLYEMKKCNEIIQLNKKLIKTDIHDSSYNNVIKQLGGKPININLNKLSLQCQNSTCMGYLSTSFICGLCEGRTCDKCFKYLGKDDENKIHICKEEDIASSVLIKNDTKPCPNCHTPIYKIDGCNQMLCTKCNTPFDWKTNKIINTNKVSFHNPHLGQDIRNPGDVPCGGIPDPIDVYNSIEFLQIWFRKYNDFYKDDKDHTFLKNIEQVITIISNEDEFDSPLSMINTIQTKYIDKYRKEIQNPDPCLTHRIKFLKKDINEYNFNQSVFRTKKNIQMKGELLNIYELFVVVGIETLRSFIDNCNSPLFFNYYLSIFLKNKRFFLDNYNHNKCLDQRMDKNISYKNMINKLCNDIIENISKFKEIIKYCNTQLKIISVTYNCKVKMFSFDEQKAPPLTLISQKSTLTEIKNITDFK